MSKYAFFRFRHNSSAMKGSWEYVRFPTDELEDNKPPWWWLNDRKNEDWSEHCRGIDYEMIAEPPVEWVEEEIEESERLIKMHARYIESLRPLISYA